MAVWNVFRILGDLTHALSKIVLIWAMHSNRSAEGISLITQVLYAVVFCSRYLDLFRPSSYAPGRFSAWNETFKILYIGSSLYIVWAMLRVFARSREREKAWRFGGFCLAGSLLAAPLVMLAMVDRNSWGFLMFTWTFSEILESVAVLPQLMLLRQTSVPTVIDSFYLVLLGSYRAFYILNWIVRGAGEEKHFDPVSTVFGTIQVLFYVDFAWVYWSRQRVKLRNGTVVDQDDISRGYLVGKVLGRGSGDVDIEGENGERVGNGWAARGISVSADEGVTGEHPQPQSQSTAPKGYNDSIAREEERTSMMHGDQEEVDFDDDEDDMATGQTKLDLPSGVTNGEEWRSDNDHS